MCLQEPAKLKASNGPGQQLGSSLASSSSAKGKGASGAGLLKRSDFPPTAAASSSSSAPEGAAAAAADGKAEGKAGGSGGGSGSTGGFRREVDWESLSDKNDGSTSTSSTLRYGASSGASKKPRR